ncbi:MAG: tRNA (N6-isopentenyl adenosine(37)-C2)-methylthiotransferase MiaB [Verrucomicrobium sp.]|jgi:tRNA-2-methylthio-N6-dimethylallyladenosine synthase|nr:tRNA (N6-isopentenyl adenosine(37)-C2)-methylthiotransferase MiaB [Verrucomicrobium sp.]
MPSVFIKTYGCQMNERDSEAVSAQLLARGYSLAPSETEADVVLLNTCSVRDMAEQKALSKMQNVIGVDRKRGGRQILGFLGCMAQSRGGELIEQLPDVDLVLGTQKTHRTGEYLDALLAGSAAKVVDTAEEAGSESAIREHLGHGVGNDSRPVTAFVSIMQGCNQHCTFCIVPSTRGEERSRPMDDIVAECRELAARGVREITLLGQIVTSYGRRMYPVQDGRSAFVQLIEAVHAIDGIDRIRFTSPHPKGYGDDLVEAYGRLPKLVESAHLPVQSGSDRLLKLMHRGYTRQRFLEIIGKLRAVRPGIGLSTDIIVGFPGETEEDFQETVSLCREVQFDQAFLFKYSRRRDTPAAEMPGQLPEEVIEDRHQRLLAEINRMALAKFEAHVGGLVEVLVEGPSHRNPARFEGRTRTNKLAVFEGSPRHHGQILDLRIERVGSFTLYGNPAIVGLD